jgi:D-proline reductase (dithiol) PrdB
MPMPRLDRLPPLNRNNLLTFPARVNDTTPFAMPRSPLTACRLAIVTTAGVHRRDDRLFGPGDQSYRVIPSSTPAAEIVQSHTSIGFDRVPIMRDLNVSFPIDRVGEMAARGELGGVAPNHYSFMGALRDTARIEAETGPEVGRRLRDEGADVALVTPT